MELFERGQLFKAVLAVIVLYPLIPIKYLPYLGIALGGYFLAYLFKNRDVFDKIRRSRRQTKLAYGLSTFLFLVLQMVSLIYSESPRDTLSGILLYFSAFIVFFVLKYEINRPNHAVPLTRAYFLSAFLVGFYHVGQVVYDEIVRGIPFDPLTNTSFMENGPVLAYFMLLALFPALTLYIFKEKNKESRFYLFVVGVSLISIFMTGSRIAIVGVFLGLLLLSLLYSVRFLIALVPAGIFFALIPLFTKRHWSYFLLSNEMGRFSFYLEVLKANAKSIFLGRGFHTIDYTLSRFMVGRPELLNLDQVNKPYNAVLQVVLELGLLGLFLGAVILYFKMRGIHNYTKSYKAQPQLKVLYVGVFVSMAVLLYVGLMDSYLMSGKIVYAVAILMGILHGDAKWKGIQKV